MKESMLLKLALIGSFIGIVLLFFISTQIRAEEISIEGIETYETGDSLILKGVVTNINKINGTQILTLAQLEKTNIVVFDSNSSFFKGDYIEVEGKIDEYHGEKNIIADKIILN